MEQARQPQRRDDEPGPAPGRGARRVVAGGVVGVVMAGTAILGGGTASALDCSPLPLVGTALYKQCMALGNTVGGATSAAKAVPRTAASAAAAAPTVVPRATKPVTGAATGAVGAVTGGASAAAPSRSSSSSSSASSGAASAPAASPAAAATAPAALPAAVPAAAPMTYAAAFDTLPASFLGSAAPGSVLPAFAGVGAAYDPGLLLTSSTPLRALAPSPVTTGSSAMPISFLDEDGRIGTPVLLSVLSVAVLAALAVRGGVLRRARRRAGA